MAGHAFSLRRYPPACFVNESSEVVPSPAPTPPRTPIPRETAARHNLFAFAGMLGVVLTPMQRMLAAKLVEQENEAMRRRFEADLHREPTKLLGLDWSREIVVLEGGPERRPLPNVDAIAELHRLISGPFQRLGVPRVDRSEGITTLRYPDGGMVSMADRVAEQVAATVREGQAAQRWDAAPSSTTASLSALDLEKMVATVRAFGTPSLPVPLPFRWEGRGLPAAIEPDQQLRQVPRDPHKWDIPQEDGVRPISTGPFLVQHAPARRRGRPAIAAIPWPACCATTGLTPRWST